VRAVTKYAKSGELSIAYQTVGDGDDLVFVPGFMSHVELNWEYAFYSAMLERLASFTRLTVLDKRGTGLSDRSLGLGTLEERMDDLRAVMDDAGIERASLMGVSEGAALSVLFAATSPDRVASLVLAAPYCPGFDPPPDEEREAFLAGIEAGWTSGDVLGFLIQHAPDDVVARAELARFERYCCTPAVAREIMRRNLEGDITSVLPTIAVPTLVVHQRGDPPRRVHTRGALRPPDPGCGLRTRGRRLPRQLATVRLRRDRRPGAALPHRSCRDADLGRPSALHGPLHRHRGLDRPGRRRR
jgi:pimeloyl-ACP methyl ester carboxylesterase